VAMILGSASRDLEDDPHAAAGRGTQGRSAWALWTSTIAFTICFAVRTIFSIIGVQIKKDLGLDDPQFGLLVGTPILTAHRRRPAARS
jgi:nitrate/nitrite transporter NarK